MTKRMTITKRKLLKYAAMYDLRYRGADKEIEDRMKSLLKRQRYLCRGDLILIGWWKSPRPMRHYKENSDFETQQVTRLSFSSVDERQRVESLLSAKGGLKGVGYPVASTVLHFAFPSTYAIMDFRVIEALGWKQPSSYTFDFWQEYCAKIRGIAGRYNLAIRTVEKALWMYSKEKSKNHQCRKVSE